MCKTIEKHVRVIEGKVLRNVCIHNAKKAKKNGNYEETKTWNDRAWNCDVLTREVMAW